MRWFIVAAVLLALGLGLTFLARPTLSDFETGSLATGTFQPQTSFAENAPVSVRVRVRSNSTRVRTAKLALGVPPNGPFQPTVDLTSMGNGLYQATLPQQPYGAHQLQLTLSFMSLTGLEQALSSGERAPGGSETRTRPFFVEAAPACFAFDTTPDPAGWTFEGIFDGDTATHVETCSAATLNPLFSWRTGFTFPALGGVSPAEGHGAIQFSFTGACYPSAAPSGFWRVDLVSPSLAARADWQGLTGFTARVISPGFTEMQAQAIITVIDAQSQTRLFRQVNAGGAPVFLPLSAGAWSEVVYTDAGLPVGSTVQNVRVRVFGAPSSFGSDLLSTRVDGVCPFR